MANFCYHGDGRKFGKTLPQHKLMQNLLGDFVPKTKTKFTKATQTEWRPATNRETCCCNKRPSLGNLVEKQIKKLENQTKINGKSDCHRNVMASIRERILKTNDCCSCSDSWSDNSTGGGDEVTFPKETRNAMQMLLGGGRHKATLKHFSKLPNTKQCAWPGIAERMDRADAEKRLINADEIVKITSQLSKNKLDIN